MSLGHHHAWPPPGHLRPPDDHHDARSVNGISKVPPGARTPQTRASASADPAQAGNLISEADTVAEEDPRIAIFRELYRRSEAKIAALFSEDKAGLEPADAADIAVEEPPLATAPAADQGRPAAPSRKPARKIDDDDYDEYDDDDEEEKEQEGDSAVDSSASPLKAKSAGPAREPSGIPSPSHRPSVTATTSNDSSRDAKKESLEEIRKKLEEDKKATEEAAKRSFHTMFYTLENDRDAMLDQQRLEESERQGEAEMSGQAPGTANANTGQSGYGSLSNANLGASSLTLKNLIARIDMKRNLVKASDAELRSLMSEVRKNRSKWASEDKIGQEELYEACEKVLSELKAQTEHSTAFLTRVNKREAPDYYNGGFGRRVQCPSSPVLIPDSYQASDGPRNYDEEAQGPAIQVKARVRGRSQSHLVKLLEVQHQPRSLPPETRPVHEKRNREASAPHSGHCHQGPRGGRSRGASNATRGT